MLVAVAEAIQLLIVAEAVGALHITLKFAGKVSVGVATSPLVRVAVTEVVQGTITWVTLISSIAISLPPDVGFTILTTTYTDERAPTSVAVRLTLSCFQALGLFAL